MYKSKKAIATGQLLLLLLAVIIFVLLVSLGPKWIRRFSDSADALGGCEISIANIIETKCSKICEADWTDASKFVLNNDCSEDENNNQLKCCMKLDSGATI